MPRTWNETQCGNDDITDGDLEEAFPRRASLASEPDLLENDVLIQVDTVETIHERAESKRSLLTKSGEIDARDVEQEPARARPDEDFRVPPFREIVNEFWNDSSVRCITKTIR